MKNLLRAKGDILKMCRWLAVSYAFLPHSLAIGQSPEPSPTRQSADAGSEISKAELRRLRPIVLPDLRKFLVVAYNDAQVSDKDVEYEFQHCKFNWLRLGKLGAAVAVEANAGHGMANAAMIDVYLRGHGSYRRIIETAGWGPMILPGPRAVPDLVFGWSAGADSKMYRYRYQHGHYAIDACDGPDDENGNPTRCEEKLPTFPDPFNSSKPNGLD